VVLSDQFSEILSHIIALRLLKFFEPYKSGTGAHGGCTTFDVWVEAFGAEFLFLFFSKRESDFGAAEYRVVLSCFWKNQYKYTRFTDTVQLYTKFTIVAGSVSGTNGWTFCGQLRAPTHRP
jgi:hypothetical protein